MPSWQARATNTLSRLLIKRRWKKLNSVDEMRVLASRVDNWLSSDNTAHVTESVQIDQLPCQWIYHREHTETGTVMLYLHGGGFCVHLPTLYNKFATRLATQLNAKVLLPDYRLAPEHPYPAAVIDCFSAYRHLLQQGIAPEQIVIAGDSAGGCLTLATLLKIKHAKVPMPACAVVMSPATDLSEQGTALEALVASDAMFDMAAIRLFTEAYFTSPEQAFEPLASPVLGELSGLPPLHIQVGNTEMILDHSLRLASRAQRAGVKVDLQVWDNTVHVHQLLEHLPESREALRLVQAFVANYIPEPVLAQD